jgi:AraC-like DNA-binding protein
MDIFVSAAVKRERRPSLEYIPRHRHQSPYLALVLSGGYEEAGDYGRRRVEPGDIVFHGRFAAHLDRFSRAGAEILNLALPENFEPAFPFARVADPDEAARLAERDPAEAVGFLLETARPAAAQALDWSDELATRLIHDPALALRGWAREHRLADATVSRHFRQIYGVAPKLFRAEARGRMAWSAILRDGRPLADLAFALGFADQAHMSRAVRAITGRPPNAWRKPRSTGFKTEAMAAA